MYARTGDLHKCKKPDHVLDLFSRANKWKTDRDSTDLEVAHANINLVWA